MTTKPETEKKSLETEGILASQSTENDCEVRPKSKDDEEQQEIPEWLDLLGNGELKKKVCKCGTSPVFFIINSNTFWVYY